MIHILISVFIVLAMLYMKKYKLSSNTHNQMIVYGGSTDICNMNNSSCTAKDNVNDPAYNMENVIKQTILLEEHIAEENKYCNKR